MIAAEVYKENIINLRLAEFKFLQMTLQTDISDHLLKTDFEISFKLSP